MLIAVDLPGYGGSDSFLVHDADTVLEAISAFILGMREEYAADEGEHPRRVIVVSHDWGSIIAFRLAAEAPQLADRFIAASAIIVSLPS